MILTARESGVSGLRDLSRRAIRGPVPWVILAVVLPFGLFALGCLIGFVAGGSPVDLGEFLGSKEYPNVGWELVLIEVIFFGCGEENGGLIAAAVFAVIRYAPSLDVHQPCTPTDPRVPDSD